MIAVLQDVGFALQGDVSLIDEQHLIGDELGIFRHDRGRPSAC
jgi:hypothetical protein